MIFLTYIFILLIFVLVSYTLYKIAKLYFNFKSKGQDSQHYPITLAITLLSIPLLSKAFSIPSYLIKVFNNYTSLDLPMPKDDWVGIVFYALYIFAVVALIYIYFKYNKSQSRDMRSPKDKEPLPISYPDIVISPHLHERIKELFELQREKQNLKLSYDEKEKVLVGQYSEAFNSYRYFIYCNSSLKEVSKIKQDEVFERLKELSHDFVAQDKEVYKSNYLFCIEDGIFEENENRYLKCYTEDAFLNVIIDFKSYLQKNIDRFDNEVPDIGGVSLKKSFIEPSFNKGESNLKVYFDEWLSEKSLRHISLLADYGMGKTSFLKYYSKYLSQKILDGEEFTRYPIFISLTNTSPMSNDGIATKIEGFVAKELGVNYALFERLVHLGKIVFILDGFDEMGFIGTKKMRREQFNSIWQLATKNNKILISGRPSYLPTDFERKNMLNIVDSSVTDVQQTPFAEVIELDYFKLEQIEETLNIYYEGSEVKEYLNYIKRNRSILDLCKRPSMLHMTMSILPKLYSENSTKIITSSDIMNKYTEYWISRQESKAITGYFSKNDNRKKEFIINFFTELSGEMFKDKTLVISKKVLDALIDKAFQKSKMDKEFNEVMRAGFKNELYSGYFIEVDINYSKEDYFKFVHKSIFEFFVSKKIIKLIEDRKFNDLLFYENWSYEIIDFIDNSIDHEKYEKSKYPSLITLKNNKLDKWMYMPIVFLFNRNKMLWLFNIMIPLSFLLIYLIDVNSIYFKNIFITFIVMLNTFLVFYALRKGFINKAYLIAYKTNKQIEKRALQFFINQYSSFSEFKNDFIANIVFKDLKIDSLYFCASSLENVSFINSTIQYMKFVDSKLNNIQLQNMSFAQNNGVKFLANLLMYMMILIMKVFSLKQKKSVMRLFIFENQKKLIFSKMTIENFDQQSLKSFQNFIKNNNMKRRDVICTSSELKDKLFAKLEGRE